MLTTSPDLVSAVMSVLYWVLFLTFLSLLLRYYILPSILGYATQIRVSYLSLLSAREIEYRPKHQDCSVVPTLRIERAGWRWGGFTEDDVGMIVLRLEGITVHVRKGDKRDRHDCPEPPKPRRSNSSAWLSSMLSRLFNIFIHHHPSVARLVSLQVSDVRIVFDDLAGLELTVKDFRVGVQISFDESSLSAGEPNALASSVAGAGDFVKHPFPSVPRDEFSPPGSPPASPISSHITAFPPCPMEIPADDHRMANVRRRASVLHTRVSSTASQVWSRFLARAQGSISFAVSVQDVAVVQPRDSISPEKDEKTPTQLESLHHFLHLRPSRNNLRRPNSEYDRLVGLMGVSRVKCDLGFGPKKHLLGEDTLRTTVDLATLQTSLEAIERLVAVSKKHKPPPTEQPKPEELWGTRTPARIILRAFESVTVSLYRVSFTHQLAAASTSSARSSTTDLSELGPSDDHFTLSLDISEISCKLDAADSSTNQLARNAFGTNSSPESKVRGIGFALAWKTIGLHCVAPGEKAEEKSQLVQMRSAEFYGLSTWRPHGWSREELLFASDPNLSLFVCSGSIASADISCDVQLLQALKSAWKRSQPPKPQAEPRPESEDVPKVLPVLPRMRIVFDLGHAMLVLADGVSQEKTTLTLASDGLHLGCFTNYSDVIARRRDKASSKAAFKQEEELQQRRESASKVDYAQDPSSLPRDLQRRYTIHRAALTDDYCIAMRADASLSLEPMSVHMALNGESTRDQHTYHIASIGRAHGTLTGDILGRQDDQEDGGTVRTLDPSSISCLLDLGIDSGIKLNLWRMPVINALVAMAEAHRAAKAESASASGPSILTRLPSGLSLRLSLGQVSMFIGHQDPNPNCKLGLARGLWIRTTLIWEYAYYNCKAQALQTRHQHNSRVRAKLRLPEDITTQALAFYNALEAKEGRAALISFTLVDTCIIPVYNGERFAQAGGTSLSHEPKTPAPEKRSRDDYVGWEFRRPRSEDSPSSGRFTNGVESLEESDTAQARKPLLLVPHAVVNWLVQRSSKDCGIEHKVTSRIGSLSMTSDMSHAYAAIMAVIAIQRIAKACKKPKPPTEPSPIVALSLDFVVPTVKAHFQFPLHEHLYLYLDTVSLSKPDFAGFTGGAKKIMSYVPSIRQRGSWEELGRIKTLSVQSAPLHHPPAFGVHADALRVRIPVSYRLSKLILNINVTIKALKLLFKDLRQGKFVMRKVPEPEEPKRLPPIAITVGNISLEAKDDPIETKLNLIWRAGLAEQEKRNELEDAFEHKLRIMEEARLSPDGEPKDGPPVGFSKLTSAATTDMVDARSRLDWWKSRSWTRRIRLAKQEQRRRQQRALRHVDDVAMGSVSLPIRIVEPTYTAPLFRGAFQNVKLTVADLNWSREEIIKYMGDMSTPFSNDALFSLMVPIKLNWTMGGTRLTLRDYPLPLVSIPPCTSGDKPAWQVDTPFIIAEELALKDGDDSLIFVPVEIIPKGFGAYEAAPFTVQVAKTIMPVKTYTCPVIEISTQGTTDIAWGNSYQPAIQDFMKVIDTLFHPPRDPSSKPGFWDKFRLTLHWKVTVNFVSSVHLHMKGTYDPYCVVGHGAGLAWAWLGGTKLEINQSNKEHETIQISSEELLVAIPDLTALHDKAAMGSEARRNSSPRRRDEDNEPDPLQTYTSLAERRYTKPCARFLNGVRVGFGFVFERTCRPWTCTEHCGSTENLLHRQCRLFDFKPHQEVLLRTPEAIERDESRIGHAVDSYEGFRSDFIHFSVSIVSPMNRDSLTNNPDASDHNSLHFSPKASAHFLAWWRLFNHTMSLPIRQGALFPHAPPPSKKFGRSLATIKYRLRLEPVFLSHMYSQVNKDKWLEGKGQILGVKARFTELLADAHQRAQEKVVRHEKLHRSTTVVHKPFYAADVLLKGTQVKLIRADFLVTSPLGTPENIEPARPRVSELGHDRRAWYNYYDFIDCDKKPLDNDPEIEIADFMDCPQAFYSMRVKARQTTPQDDDSDLSSEADSQLDVERSKFGHEKSHICYLGAVKSVGAAQMEITRSRIDELEEHEAHMKGGKAADHALIASRIKTLKRHVIDLQQKERRHIDDETIEPAESDEPLYSMLNDELAFENTFHIHCPRVFYNNASRNIFFKYWYSQRDRKKEEYTTSHASLRNVGEGIKRRWNHTNKRERYRQAQNAQNSNASFDMLSHLQSLLSVRGNTNLFSLPEGRSDVTALERPSRGLPSGCSVKPKFQLLVLKPQVAFRSEADAHSIVLLAVEEASFQGYQVQDDAAVDNVTAEVMSRNYLWMKGLQAFSPTAEVFGPTGSVRDLDFIPLEIFLDVKSEATDFDRIVLKTDACVSIDKFNSLRLARDLEWPMAHDETGQVISHLRLHQDLTTIVMPRLQVSATAKHYNALYNVVTDLLIYKDPAHRKRTERIDDFTLAFDRKDRDPQQFLLDLFHLQHSIRRLSSLQKGYEANTDLLSEDGKKELFRIRTDLLEAMEQLFTVFEAFAISQARDDARAALKSATRLDVRVGGLSWNMLRADLNSLLKIDIEGTLLSANSNKDGSNDNAVAFGDVTALNSDADALYPEVLTRYEQAPAIGRKRVRECFASACWSMLSPVGGITVVRHLAFYVQPVRFRLEEVVGQAIVTYIFGERHGKGDGDSTPKNDSSENLSILSRDNGKSKKHGSNFSLFHSSRSQSTLNTPDSSHSNVNGEHEPREDFGMVMPKDATEMRKRASAVRTFGQILMGATSFVLSYKCDDSVKHPRFTIPDCVDFKIKTPEFVYYNKVWSYRDVFDGVKRDMRNYVWSQRGDLVSQLFKKTSLFRSKKNLRHLAALSTSTDPKGSKKTIPSPSKLRYTVEPPTPLDEDNSNELARVLSHDSGTPIMRAESPTTTTSERRPSMMFGSSITDEPDPSSSAGVSEDEDESDSDRDMRRDSFSMGHNQGPMGKAVKGLLGKIRRHSTMRDLPGTTSANGGSGSGGVSRISEDHSNGTVGRSSIGSLTTRNSS